MLTKLLRIALLLSTLTVQQALALPDDQNQPIKISADSASINDKTGITRYQGNVLIKQGSMLIEAATVEMHRSNNGVEKLIAKGSPAHFRQQPEINGPYSDAWGKHMVYLVDEKKLTITQEAKVIQDQDTFTGEKIVYDLDRSIVDAFGSDPNAKGDASKGRVNMVIQPKKGTE